MLGIWYTVMTQAVDLSKHKIKLIAGRSNPELSVLISNQLGISLTNITIKDFANTEIGVEIKENVRGCNVFIIQTGGANNGRSVNDHLIELFAIVNACKLSSAKSICVLAPCYPYARSDKKDQRCAILAACLTRILNGLGVTRIVSMDLHASQIQGFSTESFDNLYAINLHIDNLRKNYFSGLSTEDIKRGFVLISPDLGGARRIEAYAERLSMHHVVLHKHRDYNKVNVVLNSTLIGNPEAIKDKTAIIIDDIFDSFGTIISAAEELVKYGVHKIIALGTHGVFSQQAIEKLNKSELIERVIVTNTLPQQRNQEGSDKITVIDISPLLATVIVRLMDGGSVSELFTQESTS